jgi:hypothetical protein
MGVKNIKDVNKSHIMYAQSQNEIYKNVNEALDKQIKM